MCKPPVAVANQRPQHTVKLDCRIMSTNPILHIQKATEVHASNTVVWQATVLHATHCKVASTLRKPAVLSSRKYAEACKSFSHKSAGTVLYCTVNNLAN